MKVSELAKESGWQVFSKGEDRAVESGYCGDFLSNIISRAPDSCAWLTVMNNVNVAAVATLIERRWLRFAGCNKGSHFLFRADETKSRDLRGNPSGFPLCPRYIVAHIL